MGVRALTVEQQHAVAAIIRAVGECDCVCGDNAEHVAAVAWPDVDWEQLRYADEPT